MIPSNWTPHYRREDGELLGYLLPTGDHTTIPVTVFGYALCGPVEEVEAEAVLDSIGLSYLADKWQLTLPDDRTIAVLIQEASPEQLIVANADYGYEGDIGHQFVLDVPEPGRLSRS